MAQLVLFRSRWLYRPPTRAAGCDLFSVSRSPVRRLEAILAPWLAPPSTPISSHPRYEGPRISQLHLTQSLEGAPVPNVYGHMRLGCNVIWTARFQENKEETGKGGPKSTTYSYSLSFAVALCEGEISRVSRAWVNGAEFDLSSVTWRLYRGSEIQQLDPLIEAIEKAPVMLRPIRGSHTSCLRICRWMNMARGFLKCRLKWVRTVGGVDRLESIVTGDESDPRVW